MEDMFLTCIVFLMATMLVSSEYATYTLTITSSDGAGIKKLI